MLEKDCGFVQMLRKSLVQFEVLVVFCDGQVFKYFILRSIVSNFQSRAPLKNVFCLLLFHVEI